MNNKFGGHWTEKKIEILHDYTRAYLTLMKDYAWKYGWKLLYFDGFAGTGYIKSKKTGEFTIPGASIRILGINKPRKFDSYYFVEKSQVKSETLKKTLARMFPNKSTSIHVVNDDGNNKLKDLGGFLNTSGKNYRTLAFIDPCGMQVNWESMEALQKRKVDVWVLIPTGLGVVRLVRNDGRLSQSWINKLKVFLGMTEQEIMDYFYTVSTVQTLFGPIEKFDKTKDIVNRSAELYKSKLGSIFDYVSEAYELKSNSNSIMYHFVMASNNKTAIKIANEIIKKY